MAAVLSYRSDELCLRWSGDPAKLLSMSSSCSNRVVMAVGR
jgi:hypothetical protein